MARILVVEDEEKIARVLELELTYEGYEVEKAKTGYEALEKYREGNWDLILLDIMLPEMSGIEILRRIRKGDSITPVILLTAKDSIEDKVTGLDLGANDYITKPFQIEELLARIRAHLRRPEVRLSDDDELTVGNLTVSVRRREVKRANERIELTPREFDLLVCLLKHKNIVLSREQLMDQVWGYDYMGDTNIVDVYIRYVRQKIDKASEESYIQTVRGVGYTIKEHGS